MTGRSEEIVLTERARFRARLLILLPSFHKLSMSSSLFPRCLLYCQRSVHFCFHFPDCCTRFFWPVCDAQIDMLLICLQSETLKKCASAAKYRKRSLIVSHLKSSCVECGERGSWQLVFDGMDKEEPSIDDFSITLSLMWSNFCLWWFVFSLWALSLFHWAC